MPLFEEFQNGFKVTVFNNTNANINDVGINVGINELYLLITNNPGINAKQLHLHFDVTSRTLERWLQELRSQNLIQFSGSKKTGGYFIVKAT